MKDIFGPRLVVATAVGLLSACSVAPSAGPTDAVDSMSRVITRSADNSWVPDFAFASWGGMQYPPDTVPLVEPGMTFLPTSQRASMSRGAVVADMPFTEQAMCLARLESGYVAETGQLSPEPLTTILMMRCGVTADNVIREATADGSTPGRLHGATVVQNDLPVSAEPSTWNVVSGLKRALKSIDRHNTTFNAPPPAVMEYFANIDDFTDTAPIRDVSEFPSNGANEMSYRTLDVAADPARWARRFERPDFPTFLHLGYHCRGNDDDPFGSSTCVTVQITQPTNLILDPVEPSGVNTIDAFWVHGWSHPQWELSTASMAGIGMRGGACRVRFLPDTDEFFVGCPRPSPDTMGILTLQCSDSQNVLAECARIPVHGSNAASATWTSLMGPLPRQPDFSISQGIDASIAIANAFADARVEHGFPRPEVLRAQSQQIHDWSPAVLDDWGYDPAREARHRDIHDAVSLGSAVPWPVAWTYSATVIGEFDSPQSVITQLWLSSYADILFSPLVDGVAVAAITPPNSSNAYVIIVGYQRMTTFEETVERIRDAWMESRDAYGLGDPGQATSASTAAVNRAGNMVAEGTRPEAAANSMVSSMQGCGFFYPITSTDFHPYSMLIEREMSVSFTLQHLGQSNRYQPWLFGVLNGGCPIR
jgi:hypothetical protein